MIWNLLEVAVLAVDARVTWWLWRRRRRPAWTDALQALGRRA